MKPISFIIVILIFISIVFIVLPNILGYSPSVSFFELIKAGVFRSYDGGETWIEKSYINETKKIASVNILDIAIDPKDSKIAYLGTRGNGLYKSYNAAENWQKVLDDNRVLDRYADIYKIAIDPKNSQNVYLAGYQNNFGVVLKSSDAGRTFKQVFISSISHYPVLDIKINPKRLNVLYIGTADGGLFESRDFGESWKIVKWFSDQIQSIAINPYNDSQIYVSFKNSGLVRSDDGGLTWLDLKDSLINFDKAQNTKTILIDIFKPNVVYLTSYFGLLKSDNYGQFWKAVKVIVPPEVLPINAIVQDPRNQKIIYIAAGSNVYKTDDGGENWIVKKINTSKKVNVIKIDPNNSQNIYLGIHE